LSLNVPIATAAKLLNTRFAIEGTADIKKLAAMMASVAKDPSAT
jgi:hypothetical protein